MEALTPPPPVEVAPVSHGFSYDGSRGEIAGIVIRNALLNLITLGFYRFWGRTRLRRYLWSRVEILGDRFAYLGTGRELFLGFAIVVGILIFLGIVRGILEFALTDQVLVGQGIDLAFVLALYILLQVGRWRARRYMLSRTTWRGIRGDQTGPALRYAALATGYGMLTAMTLGIAAPFARFELFRWRVNNTFVGSLPLRVEGSCRPLFPRWIATFLAMVVLFLGTFWLGFYAATRSVVAGKIEKAGDIDLMLQMMGINYELLIATIIGIVVGLAAYSAFSPLIWAWYRAFEFRHLSASTRIGSHRLVSRLMTIRVVMIHLEYAMYLLISFMLLAAAAYGLFSIFKPAAANLANIMETLQLMLVLVSVTAFLVAALILPTVKHLVVTNGLAEEVFRSLSLDGDGDLAAILQSEVAPPRHGEGLLDALDATEI